MRALLLLTVLAAPLAAQTPAYPATPAPRAPAGAAHADPDRMVASAGLPAGWAGRTDRGQPIAGARFEAMGTGFHVATGPAVILYRSVDRSAGAFHTLATFTQTKAPMHPEAFGLFVGGNNLDTVSQSYVYVLVRGDGMYLIKRRVGANVTTLVDWTASPAVVKADSAGKATNRIEVLGQNGSLKFTINGTDVFTTPATPEDLRGIVGLRVNHNLDVHVEGFALHQIGQ